MERSIVMGHFSGWFTRLPGQLLGRNPFGGDIRPTRIGLFRWGGGRPSLPFPHPWNYHQPLQILETYYWRCEEQTGDRHHRYLDVPGFAPVLVIREPRTIRAILTQTGAEESMFERDTMPSQGIARATGSDTLLYANGQAWWRQKKLAMPPFGQASLFQPEQFHDFEATFRHTIAHRLDELERHVAAAGPTVRIALEPEIKAVMLEMLVNNFFGASVDYQRIRHHYVPALERVIDHIVRDTVLNKLGISMLWFSRISQRMAAVRESQAVFEELTDRVLEARAQGKGQWGHFKSDAPDALLRSNIRVFLAGALEATTSYASWAISHLARNQAAQERLFSEIQHVNAYSPQVLREATYLGQVLDETLRLSPSLYFLPRRAPHAITVELPDDRRLNIPAGTHLLLDVWHANRREDHWGQAVTGHAASLFIPERWEGLTAQDRRSRELHHFGFGHGPRICPGTHLGQLEVALVVGAFVKLFSFKAVHEENPPRAGVSTKPADGVLIELKLRGPRNKSSLAEATAVQGSTGCPVHQPTTTTAGCPVHQQPTTQPAQPPG